MPKFALNTPEGKIIIDATALVREARIKMLIDTPFWGTTSMHLELVEVEPDHPYVQTMATDGERLYFNPLFCYLFKDYLDTVIRHEIGHIVKLSALRKGSRDHKKWNYATDYAINQMLDDAGFKFPKAKELQEKMEIVYRAAGQRPPEFPDPEKVVVLLDPKYRGWLAERIYDDLPDDVQLGTLDQHMFDQESKGSAGGSSSPGEPGRDGSGGVKSKSGKEFTPVPDFDSIDREAIAKKWKPILNNARQANPGSCPAGISRLIDKINEPTINWRDALAVELTSMGPADYVWNPPDKNFFGNGISLPQLDTDVELKLAILVDSSASVSHHDLRNVMSEIYGISQQFDRYTVMVMSFDHTMYKPTVFTHEDGAALVNYELRGGGGTNFIECFRYLAGERSHDGEYNEFEPDRVLVFTDGWVPTWAEEYSNDFEVTWIITDHNIVAPWGRTIHYDRYQ